jgi:nitrogen-specific signal transduction histidine kinase
MGPASRLAGSPLTSSFPLPFLLLDRAGFIRSMNEPESGHTHFSADLRIGANHLEICETSSGEGGRALAAAVRKVLAGQEECLWLPCPFSNTDRNGGCRVMVSPVREPGGRGAVLVHTPASGAHTRTPDVQAQKLEVVGRIAGGVAHDFANLVTLICGYSEILLGRVSATDAIRPELEEIWRAASRGAGMTGRLLDFIRNQAVELQVLDLNTLVADVLSMLRPIIGEHIELTTSLADPLGKVKADHVQMTRAIMNLALNARDAMPKGGSMRISTANCELSPETPQRELAPGSYVCLTLTDSGAGMDAETMSRLFEPFFTTKQGGRGTGLGLSTVSGIMKESHGGIRVASTPGCGSTFTIYLPRADEVRDSAGAGCDARAVEFGTETILLVEDEDGVRRLVKYLLSARGYTVLEARDGMHALEVYRQYRQPVHLLLTDLLMPRMNGGDLAQVMRALQPNLKVLFMSGYTGETLGWAGGLTAQGMFLQKPLRPAVLFGKIREVLETRPSSAAG